MSLLWDIQHSLSAHLPCCSPTEASLFSFMWLLIVPNSLHLKRTVRGEKVHTCVGGAISLVLVILTGSPRPCSILWWCCPWYWRCLCCSFGHHTSFCKEILYSYYSFLFLYMYTLTHIQRGWLEGMVMRWDGEKSGLLEVTLPEDNMSDGHIF